MDITSTKVSAKYSCGVCGKSARVGVILCTGQCNTWNHYRCVNLTYNEVKHFSQDSIATWECPNCFKNKVDDTLSDGEVVINCSLADELTNALQEENEELKQNLHNAKMIKSVREHELEDIIKEKEEEIEGLLEITKVKENTMEKKIQSLERKLNSEIQLKNELLIRDDNFLQQAQVTMHSRQPTIPCVKCNIYKEETRKMLSTIRSLEEDVKVLRKDNGRPMLKKNKSAMVGSCMVAPVPEKDILDNESIKEILNILQKDIEILKKENESFLTKVNVSLFEDKSIHQYNSNSQRGWEAVKCNRKYLKESKSVINNLDNFPPLKNRFELLRLGEDSEDKPSSEPTPALSRPRSRPKCKPKILLYSDSYGRGVANQLKENNSLKKYDICGTVKPSACFADVVSSVPEDAKELSSDDMVILVAGANDVARNNMEKAASGLKKTLGALTNTNVIVAKIPHRYDLPSWSCVNKEVDLANERYKNICKHFKNVSVINVSNCGRNFHTTHGQHFNQSGKARLGRIIGQIVRDRHVECAPIEVGFKDCSFLG